MTKTFVICATLAFAVVVAAFVVLALNGIDTTSLTAFIVFLAVNTVPAVGAFVKSHQIEKKVDTVVEHTNGPIAETVERIKHLEDRIGGH